MVEIVFDNNALQRLNERLAHGNALEKLKALQAENAVRLHITFVNVLEQISGITESHWTEARKVIRTVYELGFTLLADPSAYLRIECDPSSKESVVSDLKHAEHMLWSFSNYQSYIEFRDYFGENIDWYLREHSSRPLPEHPGDNEELAKCLREWLGLPPNATALSLGVLTSCCPSVSYFVAALRARQQLFPGWHFERRDYYDLMQTIYFQFCDYFVTEDRRLRDAINSLAEYELESRALSLGAFSDMLDSKTGKLAKRQSAIAVPFVVKPT